MSRTWTAKITHVSLTWSPLSSDSMYKIGEITLDSIKDRMMNAIDATDSPARELNERYAKRKMMRNRSPIRDWFFTGATRNALRVKAASEERVTIGPINAHANMVISSRNMTDHMWDVSPNDHAKMVAAVRETLRTQKIVRMVRRKTA